MTPRLLIIAALASGLALSACGGTDDEAAPETAATAPDDQAGPAMAPEPSVGAPPPEGGGVPGAAEGNPAAAPAVSTPPGSEAERDQTPE